MGGFSAQQTIVQATTDCYRDFFLKVQPRLNFMLDVGLDYLSMNRASASLSGGESPAYPSGNPDRESACKRTYILDEPSIGLHQRDNVRLINSLKQLRDTGNSVVVVEHDKDMMLEADYVIDMGPKAGRLGGEGSICRNSRRDAANQHPNGGIP